MSVWVCECVGPDVVPDVKELGARREDAGADAAVFAGTDFQRMPPSPPKPLPPLAPVGARVHFSKPTGFPCSVFPPALFMIDFKNVSVSFSLPSGDRRTVVEDVSMHLDRSEMAYLIGPTGSGKSTLLRMLYMDLFPDEGVAQIGDYRSDLIDDGEIPYLRRSLGVVFQDFQLLPDRSAYDNVAFALYATGKKRSEVRTKTMKALTRVGLNHKRGNYPHELSGGEQQRVVIASAIANDPWVLLADEPTGNLDPVVADEIQKLLVSLHRQGMTLLMATHDYRIVKKFPARTFALMNRQLIEIDPESL